MQEGKDRSESKGKGRKLKGRMQYSLVAENATGDGLDVLLMQPVDKDPSAQKQASNPPIKRPQPQMEKSLQEMGRKARIRLEEERSKRKEIVRLTDGYDCTATGNNLKKGFKFAKTGSSRVTKGSTSKKRRRKGPSTSINSQSLTTSKKSDPFSVDVRSASFFYLPKTEKSHIIRLHGLPIGIGVDSVYSFFAGLNPESVIVLPSMDIDLTNFDTTFSSQQKVPTIKRYPETFRVYVSFQSPLVAEAAMRRYGEMIHIGDRQAALSLSPVPKSFVGVIENNLRIECRKSMTVEEALKEAENQIPPVISQILWVKAIKILRLKCPLQTIGDGDDFPSIDMHDIENIFPKQDERGREKLVDLHNNFVDLYEEICKHCAPFQCEEIDPMVTKINPSFRLTTIAVSWILDQMRMIQNCLISSNRLR